MFFNQTKRELKLLKSFQKLFFDEHGMLKEEAKIVLSFLRDESGARGELGQGQTPYFYDAQNRFDVNAAAFLLGKRRMFDLIVKYLSLNEIEVFHLSLKEDKREEEVKRELSI